MELTTLRRKLQVNTSFETRAVLRIALIAVLLVILAIIVSDGIFAQPANLTNLGLQNSMLVVISLGQLLVILTGGIDLSVGALMALSSVLVVLFQDFGIPVAITLALLVSTLLGVVNGFLVAYIRLPSFVVTLGMMQIAYSLAMVFSKGGAVYTGLQGATLAPIISGFYKSSVFGIPQPLIFVALTLVAGALYLRTRFGHFIYPVGGNESAAFLSGLPVKQVKISVYALSALMAAIAGVLYVARVGHGYPQAGQWIPLDSIAAVSIGGASLSGGVGTVLGTLIGVLILSVLSNIMNLLGVPPTLQPAVKGAVILIAVFFNSSRKQN